MKKSVIKISLAFGIITALVLILLGLRLIDSDVAVTSYRFLAGQKPVVCKKAKIGNKNKRYIYSFEADFDDLWSKAYSELKPEGFIALGIVQILSGKKSKERTFHLKEKFPRGPVGINIYNNRQCIKLPNSNDYGISPRDGWVMVEIVYWRGLWWPF